MKTLAPIAAPYLISCMIEVAMRIRLQSFVLAVNIEESFGVTSARIEDDEGMEGLEIDLGCTDGQWR